MAIVEKSVLLPFSAAQMYNLVERVEDYPRFLPWCPSSAVSDRTEDGMVARIDIRFSGVEQSFTTANVLLPQQHISMELREGPFSRLNGNWQFTALRENGCKVEFRLEYAFSNGLLEKLVGPAFQHIASTMVESFTRRAQEIYR